MLAHLVVSVCGHPVVTLQEHTLVVGLRQQAHSKPTASCAHMEPRAPDVATACTLAVGTHSHPSRASTVVSLGSGSCCSKPLLLRRHAACAGASGPPTTTAPPPTSCTLTASPRQSSSSPLCAPTCTLPRLSWGTCAHAGSQGLLRPQRRPQPSQQRGKQRKQQCKQQRKPRKQQRVGEGGSRWWQAGHGHW